MKTTLRVLLIAALLLLAACGNKGKLVLPDKASPASDSSPASDASSS